MQNNLVVFNRIPALLPIPGAFMQQRSFPPREIHLTNRAVKPFVPTTALCTSGLSTPSKPTRVGHQNSCDNHPLCLVNRVFCHL